MRVLYISYDGVLEPLGESQVVAYLERLASRAAITLLSFEKPADLDAPARAGAMRARLERAGITWIVRRYHKQPPVVSTAFDIVVGCLTARRWARSSGIRDSGFGIREPRSLGPGTSNPSNPESQTPNPGIVHARGYVPALIALYAKRAFGTRFLFDMRGFWVDEKVEAGHWRAGGVLYLIGKWCERRFFAEADAIVSLTAAGVREFPKLGSVGDGVPVAVIPTCADLDRFAPAAPDIDLRRRLGLDSVDGADAAIVAGYAGTMSNWYLREETLAYLAWMARTFDRMKALIVTREDHGRLRADAVRAGLPADRLVLTRATLDEMPALMRLMHVGVFFIRPCFSKRASAATRLAEFLGCGVPVVINDGIGDSGDLVRRERVGLVLDKVSDTSDTSDTSEASEVSEVALREILTDPAIAVRCRKVAERDFSLTHGVEAYAKLYAQLSH